MKGERPRPHANARAMFADWGYSVEVIWIAALSVVTVLMVHDLPATQRAAKCEPAEAMRLVAASKEPEMPVTAITAGIRDPAAVRSDCDMCAHILARSAQDNQREAKLERVHALR